MCPSDDQLGALLDGALPADELRALHRHADGCIACRRLLAELARGATAPLPPAQRGLPRADGPAPRADPSGAPEVVGRYQIVQHLASGGMGAVYAAYDPELDRRVAVKILTDRAHTDAERLTLQARLQREAQAMARLAHPHVVAVYDVGTHADDVFLAMEYVEGATLRDWLATPRSWRQIRDVFVQAARGLAAAHAVGLVHRDFKPDNVLVGVDGRARVADFGLARGTVDAAEREDPAIAERLRTSSPRVFVTRAGTVLGTPRYMAPEQIRAGEVDARTDQFSFGVALYQALFGVHPFGGKTLEERLEAIAARRLQPPPAPHSVPEWLARAVRRMLSPHRDDRFASMEHVISALERDARARRLGASAVALSALVSAVAVAAGSWAVDEERRCEGAERHLAGAWDAEIRDRVRQAFTRAVPSGGAEAFARTAPVLDAFATGWAKQHAQVCQAMRVRRELTEAQGALQMACLHLRRKELSAVTTALATADAALVQRAVDAAVGLSAPKACGDVAALAELAPLPEDPESRGHLQREAEALAEATALRLTGRYPEALERAVAVASQAGRLRYRPLEADALYLKGALEEQLGRLAEAQETLRRAVWTAEASRNEQAKIRAANRLVYVAALSGEPEVGKQWAGLARATLERIGGDRELEGEVLMNLGTLHLHAGDAKAAIPLYEEAVSLLRASVGEEHPKSFNATINLAAAYTAVRDTAGAAALLEDAMARIARVRGPQHPTLIAPLFSQAWVRLQLREFAGAHRSIDRALELAEARHGREHPKTAGALELKATIHQESGELRPALETYREALRVREALGQADRADIAFALDGVGQASLGLGRAEEALPFLERALALRAPGSSATPADRADTAFALAKTLRTLRRQPGRVRALAASAERGYRESGRRDRAEAVVAWLRSEG